ncbi:hypothetical protein SAMN04488005_0237 [Yoonia tamlensis]|uniref:Uncharacterized protein n=1 Tax=Yoonia tamlensis TaxID=390270 RepID=A0A1I6FQ35_9RHOB|nr:hypothetical protein SAMN04488005_0237 [Yoonia tamlensis]
MMQDNLQVIRIESEFYDALVHRKRQTKVAMLIATTFRDKEIPSEEYINLALDQLVLREDVQSFGLIHRWRHSELKWAAVNET